MTESFVDNCIEAHYENSVRTFLECENGEILNDFENYVLHMKSKRGKGEK